MPYKTEWVEPELFLEHRGVKVYCTYKDGDFEQGPRTYGYTLDPQCEEGSCAFCEGPCRNVFDVRELANWIELSHPSSYTDADRTPEVKAAWDRYRGDKAEEKHIQQTLIEAIEMDLLPPIRKDGPRN